MQTEFSEGMRSGTGAQWETERRLANPTIGFVLLTVGGSTSVFLALAWLCEAVLGVSWPLVAVALFLSVTLIQGPPDELFAAEPARRRAPFLCAAWGARTVLVLAFYATSSLALGGQTIAWRVAGLAAFVFVPVLWLPLHQLRQFGLLSLVGVFPVGRLWRVGLVTIGQAALISTAALSWLAGDTALSARVVATIAAACGLFGGNILLAAMSGHAIAADSI